MPNAPRMTVFLKKRACKRGRSAERRCSSPDRRCRSALGRCANKQPAAQRDRTTPFCFGGHKGVVRTHIAVPDSASGWAGRANRLPGSRHSNSTVNAAKSLLRKRWQTEDRPTENPPSRKESV